MMSEEVVPMLRFQPAAVPVVPNASMVRGKLLRIKPEPDGQGAVWEIRVDEARDVQHYPNFAESYVGEIIPVYVHEELQNALAEQDMLEARIAFRGGEHGGRFVLTEDDMHRL